MFENKTLQFSIQNFPIHMHLPHHFIDSQQFQAFRWLAFNGRAYQSLDHQFVLANFLDVNQFLAVELMHLKKILIAQAPAFHTPALAFHAQALDFYAQALALYLLQFF
ncbi:hypothetical protein NC651_034245 [Populus alba x Populus x berolinensis]|nr:hypothetical protein NC651_034245 [Populus alba x Populus x berolinensis]